jgi:hypothetical protein
MTILRTLATPNISLGYRYISPKQTVFVPTKFSADNLRRSPLSWWNHEFLTISPSPGFIESNPTLIAFASERWAREMAVDTDADTVVPIRAELLEFVSDRMRLKSMIVMGLWSDLHTRAVHVDCAIWGARFHCRGSCRA